MEVEQQQESEMAEATPKLYDIIHPTPVSLKELSSMAICVEIWRDVVNEYRTSGKLEEFKPDTLHVGHTCRIKSKFPDLPATIYKTIEKFFTIFVDSIDYWLSEHQNRVFGNHNHRNYVLEYFDDFVCDCDGSIHYTRTAERMMRCVRFNTEIKFIIACTYFFEDDIRRLWPSVRKSTYFRVNSIAFYESPQLYYWICRLRKQLRLIPPWKNYTVDERMFRMCMHYNRPSVEYFWNRIPLKKRLRRADRNLGRSDFVRFILPKLNERQLYKFANCRYGDGFAKVFLCLHSDECGRVAVLRTWSYIKNFINENKFNEFVVKLIEVITYDVGEKVDAKKWEPLSIEVWNDTPANLKQSAIRRISSESDWLKGMDIFYDYDPNLIHVKFLFRILQDASFDDRRSFWRNCWETLLEVVQVEDLQRMMELCFEKEEEITEFKRNVMVNSEDALEFCVTFLTDGLFDHVNVFVRFFCPELQTTRNFKQRILQSAFLGGHYLLNQLTVSDVEEFNVFVNDVSTDFKNMLMSSPAFMEHLARIICDKGMPLKILTKFIATLVSMEEVLAQIKIRLSDSLKAYVITNNGRYLIDLFREPEFHSILLWCLGSNEAVVEFKLTCYFSLT